MYVVTMLFCLIASESCTLDNAKIKQEVKGMEFSNLKECQDSANKTWAMVFEQNKEDIEKFMKDRGLYVLPYCAKK